MIPKRKRKHLSLTHYFLFFIVGLFMFFTGMAQYFIVKEQQLTDKIYPNVFIDNVDQGGKTKAQAEAPYLEKNQALQNINIQVLYKDNPIATFSAQKLNIHSNGAEVVERAYLIGRTNYEPSRFFQKISSFFRLTSYTFATKIVYDKDALNDFISTIEDQYNRPAKNALFTFENGKVVSFREDEKGLKVNTDLFFKDLDVAVTSFNKKSESKTIVLKDTAIEPEVSLKTANNFGIEELVAVGRSNYAHSIPERIHNVTLAASKFNGVIIPKGSVFSFDDIIGDISASTGYKPAYVIKNGKTVLGDGGGVCQVSTTLFRAALNAGLPIVERTAHAYRVGYYENDSKPGFDATVFSPYVDLKFKNDTPAALLVQVENDQDTTSLTFKFYGKKDNRKIELSDVSVYDEQPPPPPIYQDDSTLRRGVTKQVDFAASGATASFYYKVSKGSEVSFEKKFISYFKPWQAVYLVGTAD